MSNFIKNIDVSTISFVAPNTILNAVVTESIDRQTAINNAVLNLTSLTQVQTLLTDRFTAFLSSINIFTAMNKFTNISVGIYNIFVANTSIIFNNGIGNGGSFSVAIGHNCLIRTPTAMNCNTGIGVNSLFQNESANNTAVGYGSLDSCVNGLTNTAIGFLSGQNNMLGSNNTYIGQNTGQLQKAVLIDNSTAIGSNAIITSSNQIVLGTEFETTNIPGKLQLQKPIEIIYTTPPVYTINHIGYQSTTTSPIIFTSSAIGNLTTMDVVLPFGIFNVAYNFEFFNNLDNVSTGYFNHYILQPAPETIKNNKVNFNLPIGRNHPISDNMIIRSSTNTTVIMVMITIPTETPNPQTYSVRNVSVTTTRIA